MNAWTAQIDRLRDYLAPLRNAGKADTGVLAVVDRRVSRCGILVACYLFTVLAMCGAEALIIEALGLPASERTRAYSIIGFTFVLGAGFSLIAWEFITSWPLGAALDFTRSTDPWPDARALAPGARARSVAVVLELLKRCEYRFVPGVYDRFLKYCSELLASIGPADHVRLARSQREALYDLISVPTPQDPWSWRNRKFARDALAKSALQAIAVLGQADAIPHLRKFTAFGDPELRGVAADLMEQLERRVASTKDELLRATDEPFGIDALPRPAAGEAGLSPEELLRSNASTTGNCGSDADAASETPRQAGQ